MSQPAPKRGGRPVYPELMQSIDFTAGMGDGWAEGLREAIKAALMARVEFGRAKYGMELSTSNGRNAMVDAWEECADMCFYLQQALMEGDTDVALLHYSLEILGRLSREIGPENLPRPTL